MFIDELFGLDVDFVLHDDEMQDLKSFLENDAIFYPCKIKS